MLVLGIETSCDETGVALIDDGRLLGESLASQTDIHAVFGGVVPEIASREHQKMLPALFHDLLRKTGASPEGLSGVAVARGPGLLGSLLVGLSFAKGLCLATEARLVGVDHLHAHILAAGLQEQMLFPALGVLVSGGHTHIYRVDAPTRFTLLGRTLDDAAGEAFDKVAKLLNLPYPGGRYLDEMSQGVEPERSMFPLAYVHNDNLDFSFSGLKTAVAERLAARPHLPFPVMPQAEVLLRGGVLTAHPHPAELSLLAASFNYAVAETLRVKVARALDRDSELRAVVVAGGVAANSHVRAALRAEAEGRGLAAHMPKPSLCTDNAAMVAHAGWLALREGYSHGLDLESIPRGRAVPRDWTRDAPMLQAMRLDRIGPGN